MIMILFGALTAGTKTYLLCRSDRQALRIDRQTKVWVCDSGQNLKMNKTSSYCFIHQENTCKSDLHSNLIILADCHSFTVNEDKLQN